MPLEDFVMIMLSCSIVEEMMMCQGWGVEKVHKQDVIIYKAASDEWIGHIVNHLCIIVNATCLIYVDFRILDFFV